MTVKPKTTPVVTCFLQSEGKILLLKRSEQVSSYQGRWAGVSGYLESEPDQQAFTEIQEETGLSPTDITLAKKGQTVLVVDTETGAQWLVHPYLFYVNVKSKIRIDWEHKSARWVKPEEIADYATVPGLDKVLAAVIDNTTD